MYGRTRVHGRRSRSAWIAGGDGHALSDAERAQRTEFWRHVVKVRLAATFVIPAALALLPIFGPQRYVLALIAFVAGLACNGWLLHNINRGNPIPRLIAMSDLLTAVLVIALVPLAYSIGITLIVSMTSLYVFWFGRRTTVQLIGGVGVALVVIGVWRQPELWVPAWIAWLITSALGTVILSSVAEVSMQTRNRYNDLVNGIDALVWESAGEGGDADYVSDRVIDLLGFSPAEFANFSFLASHVHPDDIDELVDSRRRITQGESVEVHYRIRDALGRTRHLHERVTVALDAEGRTCHRRGVMIDETARTEAESSVRGYADFIEGIPIALSILRLDDMDDPASIRVVIGNPASALLVGMSLEHVVGQRLTDLFDATPEFLDRLADVVRLQTSLEQPAIKVGDNDEVYALRAMPLPDQCIGISLDDVTKRARIAESLRHQALHDHLTGLPNRARFSERLDAALTRTAAEGGHAANGRPRDAAGAPAGSGTDRPETALIMMDLNQFKEVNDTLGHEYGDRLLIEVSRRLARGLRGCDTISRLGGDEFAILLTGPGAGTTVDEVAERVHELTGQPFQIDEHRLQVGSSIGIAVCPDHAEDGAALMRHADAAMYRAKAEGGGIVRYSSAADVSGGTQLELLSDLWDAVQSDQLVVHYQPRIDLVSLRTLGVEALVRWEHPSRGLLPPAEFIELAEVSGAISALTRVVTERATTDLNDLPGSTELCVSINLSARNLQDPMLVSWVADLLERTGFPPTALCFELTEAQLNEDPAQALEALHGLRRLGVRLCIDDFGTGYSSLAYLRELPIDEVKIDPSFIADLDGGDTTLVRSVIDLAHNLGLHVVAEGVETPSALATLRDLGCDSAQGFHLASPMPLVDLTQFLGAGGGVATPPPYRGHADS